MTKPKPPKQLDAIADIVHLSHRAKAAQPLHPVHEISAWSGDPDDESPICGADKDGPNVWGYRTVYTNQVTCQACIAARERWADLQDGESDAVSGSLHTRW